MTAEQHLEQLIGNMALRMAMKDAELDTLRPLKDENEQLKAKIAKLEKKK